MITDLTTAGFILTVFCAGVAVGKIVERIEKHLDKSEDEENKLSNKNDRR